MPILSAAAKEPHGTSVSWTRPRCNGRWRQLWPRHTGGPPHTASSIPAPLMGVGGSAVGQWGGRTLKPCHCVPQRGGEEGVDCRRTSPAHSARPLPASMRVRQPVLFAHPTAPARGLWAVAASSGAAFTTPPRAPTCEAWASPPLRPATQGCAWRRVGGRAWPRASDRGLSEAGEWPPLPRLRRRRWR